MGTVTTRRCLNCGEELSGNYCANCGQSSRVRRLSARSMAIDMAAGFTRVNRGFVHTALCLLTSPWRVTADYIHCRRAPYTPPVQMLLVLCFIYAVVGRWFVPGAQSGIDISMPDTMSGDMLRLVVSWYADTLSVQYITVFFPCLLLLPAVYGRYGARRFNVAEYVVAGLYFSSAYVTFAVVTLPLHAIFGSSFAIINVGYCLVLGSLFIFRAFPVRGRVRRFMCLALYLLLTVVLAVAMVVIIAMTVVFIFDIC